MVAVSFTRNNVGVISDFRTAKDRGKFARLIRSMDRKLTISLVDDPSETAR